MADPRPFRVSLCADDYAMTPAVSHGILELLDAGALTATSVMTTMPSWREAATDLRPHAGRADIGLHLNLTAWAPLGSMPRLAPTGVLPSIGRYVRGGKGLPLDEIEAEIGRQIDAFTAIWGAPPDHCDGHQHVHALPTIRPLLMRQLRRRGFAGRPWIRDSADLPARIVRRGGDIKKALGLAVLTRGGAAAARAAGFATNQGFAGFSSFRADEAYPESFARYLVRPGPHHLIMCHPGHVDEALRRLDPVTDSRERELGFFLSRAFRDLLESRGATLARLDPAAPP